MMQAACQFAHRGGSQHCVCRICQGEDWAKRIFDAGKVAGCVVAGLVAQALGRQELLADEVCQVTGVDTHRAGHGAKSVACTSLVAGIVVLLEQQSQSGRILAALSQPCYFAISRWMTMRWREDRVKPHDTQFTSQKPHSMQRSTFFNEE